MALRGAAATAARAALGALALATGLLAAGAAARVCDSVSISSQAEVEVWSDCTSVVSLTISNDVYDLSPLSGLAQILGGLAIMNAPTLGSLDGLQGVSSLGKDSDGYSLYVKDVAALESVAGLHIITGPIPGGVFIENAPALASLDGLQGVTSLGKANSGESLFFHDVIALESLAGLRNVTGTMPGSICVWNVERLASLDGLQGITSLGKDNDGYSLYLKDINSLKSLVGLDNVATLAGSIMIEGGGHMASLDGLQGMTSLGKDSDSYSLYLHFSALKSLAGLDNAAIALGGIFINDAPYLASMDGLQGIKSIGMDKDGYSLYFQDVDALQSVAALRNVTGPIPGSICVWNAPRLASLDGLQGVTSLGKDSDGYSLYVKDVAALESVAVLGSITGPIPGGIFIENAPSLASLHGLQGITSLADDTALQLTNTNLRSLHGLEGLSEVKSITIESNAALESLSGLASVTRIPGNVAVNRNPVLRSVLPLPRILAGGYFQLLRNFGTRCYPESDASKLAAHQSKAGWLGGRAWDTRRCHACTAPCGSKDNKFIDCDFESGQCRCPLGFSGPNCSLPTDKVHVEPNQLLKCELGGGNASEKACMVRIRLQRERRSVSGSEPSALAVYAGYGHCGEPQYQLGLHSSTAVGVTWVNGTHGFIDVRVVIGEVHCIADVKLPLAVGYHPHLYPDSLVQGTVLDHTAAAFPLYPWCLDSGECKQYTGVAAQLLLKGTGLHCTQGQIVDGLTCTDCPLGFVALPGSTQCTKCSRWASAEDRAVCSPQWEVIALAVGGLCALACSFACACSQIEVRIGGWHPRSLRQRFVSMAVGHTAPLLLRRGRQRLGSGRSSASSGSDSDSSSSDSDGDGGCSSGTEAAAAAPPPSLCKICTPYLLGRPLTIEDVTLEQGQTILKTTQAHRLAMWSSSSFHIFFEDTKHPRLDAPSSPFRARVFGPDRLEILDEHARSITEHLDTSTGVARLSLVRTLWHTRYVGPAACVAPGLLALGLVYIFLLAGQGRGDVEQSYADVIAWDFVAAMAVAAAATTIQRCRAVPPQLQHQIRRFREVLTQGNPRPEPCAKGPGRAIQAGTLLDFFGHFQGFIRDRAMYYVVSNIVFPLTLPSKLSFAELAGPGELDWFVSHFWGHRFQELCASIQKHAQISGSGKTWRDARYWICSFSNNQHRVAEELGTDWSNSSFYLALLGAGRRGTCLVVDEQALPLTRSWCLFEVAQTVELDKKSLTGEGHLMFCTASGVVNEGSASAEVSLGLAKRLATLRLQDASASNPKDQAMIEEFVKSDMGGFGKMNKCVRDRIALALDRAKDVVLGDFETLQATLKQSVEEEGSRVAL